MLQNPEIILGSPGTGKTTALLKLVEEELARGVPPDRIGYVSFTKRAATEAVERACTKFGLTEKDLPYFRTLHSTCFRALGVSSGDIMEGKKLREFGDWIGTDLTTYRRMDEGNTTGFTPGDRAMFMENMSRVCVLPLRQLYDRDSDDLSWTFVDNIARGLRQFKKDRSLHDYTDLLQMFVESGWTPKLEVLFVDESQDLSLLQWRVVDKLARNARRVVVAGDDDQAIYRWAGAAVEHFVSMSGEVTVLGKSWRVPATIQGVAERIINTVRNRRPKKWAPREGGGKIMRPTAIEQIDFTHGDILLLSRNNFNLRDAEPLLKQDGILYEYHGKSSVSREILDAVRFWEHLRKGNDLEAKEVSGIYDYMSAGVGYQRGYKKLPGIPADARVTLADLKERGGLLTDEIWHRALDRIPEEEVAYMLKILRRGEKLTGKPRVRLSTIHGSKGGEADHVVLVTDMARRTYKEYEERPEDEARVWYVAATRAKEQLSIVAPHTKLHYGL
jgi:DNA helicase II / ATP-dependent DNA helicase PcrA